MQKLNLPNKLTLIRMFLAPIYLALMLIEFPYHYIVALAVFAVASLTDMLDGKIARKNNLADKMLTTAALLAFMREGWCSIWIVMIVLTREFAVAGVRLIATAQGIVIPANYWGKAKTVSQMVFTIVIMLLAELDATFDIFANAGWFTLESVEYHALDNRRSDGRFGHHIFCGQQKTY